MKVKFVYTPEWDEVTAIFVDNKRQLGLQVMMVRDGVFGISRPFYILCYSHIGQHHECVESWFEEQQPATFEQYAPLLAELQSIGYEVGFNVPIEPFTPYEYPTNEVGKFRQGDVIIDEQGEVSVVLQIHSDGEFRGDANGNGCEGRYATLEEITSQRPEILTFL